MSIVIIPSIVLGVLLLLVFVVLIGYVVYYFMLGGGVAANKAKLAGPFLQGLVYVVLFVAHSSTSFVN